MFLWSLYLLVKSDILNVIDVSNFSFLFFITCSVNHVWLFVTSWAIARQSPLPMGFLRQEYWSGLPLPTPGDLPDPRTKPVSPSLAGRFFTIMPFGSSCLKSVGNLPLAFFFNFAFLVETFDDDRDSGDRLMIGDRCYWNNSGVKSLSWLPRQVRQRVLLCAPTVACASWCSTCCFIMICFWICLLCQLKLLGDTNSLSI